jgi:hypothetical protein
LDADIPFGSWSPLLDGGFPLDGDVPFTWSNVHLVPVELEVVLELLVSWDMYTQMLGWTGILQLGNVKTKITLINIYGPTSLI